MEKKVNEMSDKVSAILVNVSQDKNLDKVMEELTLLADTAGYKVVGTLVQKRAEIDKKFYIGTGKLEELKALVLDTDAEMIIFDNDINGIQYKNLEDFLEIDVIDRATLILQIFARHATTNEGKLQVELATKKHNLPRALGQNGVLSRVGGGGGGGGGARRGAGEQKLEIDKRTIKEEIRDLERKLNKLTSERRLRREKRIKSNIKVVSIVGYTNAGKSTLMNTMTKANVLEEDKLFATLDPVSRKFWLAPGKEFLLIDTVGFISRLPHEFINAFKSTLEETVFADLIIHVVDGSSADMMSQYDTVCQVLESLDVKDTPVITVVNKCDKATINILPTATDCVTISARTGYGIEQLKNKISNILFGE